MADPSNDALRTLSVDTLRWQGLDTAPMRKNESLWKKYEQMVRRLKRYANDCLYLRDRSELFRKTRQVRVALQDELKGAFAAEPALAEALGLDPARKTFEVHELRRATRSTPDGELIPQVIVSLLQTQAVRADASSGTPAHTFRGGSTLLVDLVAADVKYCVVKRVRSSGRRERTAAFLRDAASDPLSALMLVPDELEPFALLHSVAGGAGEG